MPSPSPSLGRLRRLLLAAAVVLTVSGVAAPAVVSSEATYSLSYVGVDYEAGAVRDTASFWSSLDDDEQSTLTAARRAGTATLSERPGYLDGDGDVRFSVVHDERVYQYRLDHATDPWWLDYRFEVTVVGVALTVGTVWWGAVRRVETLWE